MNKTKKVAILLVIPAMAFLLSGCGSKKDNTPPTSPASSITQKAQQPATSATQQNSSTTQQDASAAAAKQKATLEALPTDDKSAIDTELGNIDKELKTTDTSINQNEFSDTELGL